MGMEMNESKRREAQQRAESKRQAQIRQERMYGFSGEEYADKFRDEEGLFTKITEGMRTATERDTYKPFFDIQSQARQGSFLSKIDKRKSTGFASEDTSMMDMMEDEYARGIMGVEEGIQSKMTQAQQNINNIIAGNQQTILTLRQIEEG
tara:strand:+ start:684 stop:1133 length:450 start_codon:yes stop_codon:yes gene_type:complete